MGKTVLLIEDDLLVTEIVSRKMDKADFAVENVINAEEARGVLEKKKPDIILLDLILPGMNGLDFLQELKKDERFKDIPVIILSNLGSRDEVDKGMILGADAYLIKSNIFPEDIIAKIKEVLKASPPSGQPED